MFPAWKAICLLLDPQSPLLLWPLSRDDGNKGKPVGLSHLSALQVFLLELYKVSEHSGELRWRAQNNPSLFYIHTLIFFFLFSTNLNLDFLFSLSKNSINMCSFGFNLVSPWSIQFSSCSFAQKRRHKSN